MPVHTAAPRLKEVFDSGRELAEHLDVQSEILRLAPFGVVLIGEDGVICGVNRYLRDKLGYIWRSDLVGNGTLIEALLPDDLAAAHKKFREAWFKNPLPIMLHGRDDRPFYVRHKQGKLLRCFLAVFPLERTRCGDMICTTEAAEDSTRYAVTYLVFPGDFAGDGLPEGPPAANLAPEVVI